MAFNLFSCSRIRLFAVIFVATQRSFGKTLIAQTRYSFVLSRFSFEFGNPHDKKFEVQIYTKKAQ